MSTTKTFTFYPVAGGNVNILNGYAIVYSILEERNSYSGQGNYTVQNGSFNMTFSCNSDDLFYIIMSVIRYEQDGTIYDVGPGSANNRPVDFLAVFSGADNTIYVGPMSTVSTAFCFAKAIELDPVDSIIIKGNENLRKVAYAMTQNFYHHTTGKISPVISSSPNNLETNSYPAFNFLSNILYYCLTDAAVFKGFIGCTGNQNVVTSMQGMTQVALYPFNKVKDIYDLISTKTQIFMPSLPGLVLQPGMSPIPNQWTLAIKVNDSGADNFLIAGTAYVVFDVNNRGWITNNFRQGTANSGSHCMVFEPDGSPSHMSPLTGGGILGPGFGVAVNKEGTRIAFGNYGWGPKEYNPYPGSVSIFDETGKPLTPGNGFTNDLSRLQGMCYDREGNLWMASWGTQDPMAAPHSGSIYEYNDAPSAVVVYIGGDPARSVVFNDFGDGPSPFHGTFSVVMDHEGNAIVSNAGTSKVMGSSVYKLKLSAGKDKLDIVAAWPSNYKTDKEGQINYFEEFRQVQVDADNNVYVGGITSKRVVKLDKDLKYVTAFTENIYGPWGITVDDAGMFFVTGFGEETTRDPNNNTLDMRGPFGITVVSPEDESWTNTKLMTLPSGGSEVLMANGQPLYGNQPGPNGKDLAPSYQPLMRVTSTGIDRAGNLWACNNWKPSLYDDVKFNPGGDGVVIFVGVAEPSK